MLAESCIHQYSGRHLKLNQQKTYVLRNHFHFLTTQRHLLAVHRIPVNRQRVHSVSHTRNISTTLMHSQKQRSPIVEAQSIVIREQELDLLKHVADLFLGQYTDEFEILIWSC